MRRIIDIGFIVLLVLGCLGLDYYIVKRDADAAAKDFGWPDYVALRKDDFNDLLHPPSLEAAMPTSIDGWEITPRKADLMVGPKDNDREGQAHEIALVKAMAALTKASSDKGEMFGTTMVKGDTRLRVVTSLVQQAEAVEGIETASTGTVAALAAAATAAPPADAAALQAVLQAGDADQAQAVYDVVDGVAFTELPATEVTGDPDIRMIRATLTPALSVTVITKSDDDAAIKEALQAIDFVMLNKLLNSPVDGVIDGSKTDLRSLQPVGSPMARLERPAVIALPSSADTSGARDQLAIPEPLAEAIGDVAARRAPSAPAKTAPAETAVFVTPPDSSLGTGTQPCTRRAGVLVCPDG